MQAELFEGVSEQTRQRILETARDESFAKGDFMFRLGEPARHFYILGEGRVRLTLGQGERLTYVASSPSELIGWSSLVDNESYTASAECLVPVKVLKIEKSAIGRGVIAGSRQRHGVLQKPRRDHRPPADQVLSGHAPGVRKPGG